MNDYEQKMVLQNDLSQSTVSQSSFSPPVHNLEGILEVLNDPPNGYREFCGKYIELPFLHTTEWGRFHPMNEKDIDNTSVAVSEYIEDGYESQAPNIEILR